MTGSLCTRSFKSLPTLVQFPRFCSKLASSMAREDFKIRLIKTEEEFQAVVINAMLKEDWRPGLKDAECFLACDPTSKFIGELNGKPVSCITMTKYGDNFAFVGNYIVNKEYRGKGYGMKLYNAAVTNLKPSCNIGMFGSLKMEKAYERSGFRSHVYGAHFNFHLPTAVACFSEISEKFTVKIKRVEEVDLNALLLYDTEVFGFKRHAFLSKWVRVTGSHALVAVDSEGSIVGYTVARPNFVKEEGYKIGPLFADCEVVAEKLLKAVFEELIGQGKLPPDVSIDAPTTRAMELAEKLQGKKGFPFVYMTTKDPPDVRFDKWFGVTTLEIG